FKIQIVVHQPAKSVGIREVSPGIWLTSVRFHIAVNRLIGKRMVVLHKVPKPFFQHMRVDLGRRYVRMSKQLLDRTQVSAVLQQMTRKGMTQYMWRSFGGGDASPRTQQLQLPRKDLAGQIALP